MTSILKIFLIICIFFINTFAENTIKAKIDTNSMLSLSKNYNDILTDEEKQYLEENKDLILAFTKDWKLMSFYNEKNKISGFHIDLLKQINKNLNTNIGYKVYNSWTKAYEDSKNAKINGIFGLSWSKKREDFFIYSPAYFFAPTYLVARKNDKSINGIKNLENKIAIIQKNSIHEIIIKNSFPKVKIMYSKNHIDSFEKIKNKIVDFTIKDDAYEYDLDKYNLMIKKTFLTKSGELHIGTSKDDKIFASIIKKGISSINNKQLSFIKNKWKNKKAKKSVFTKEELAYIKKSPKVITGVLKWGEALFIKDNKISGFVGDILKKISEVSGLEFEPFEDSWPNLIQKIKNKEIHLIPTVYYEKQREEFGYFTDSYFKVKEFIYTLKDNYSINSLNDLNYKKVAVIKNFKSIKLLKEYVKNIQIIETDNLEESIIKLINKDVDAIFETQISIEDKLKELFVLNVKTISQNKIEAEDVHLFSVKDDLLLKNILRKSLYSISIQDKNKIYKKWLQPKEIKKSVNIALKVGREPFVLDKTYLKGIEYELLNKALNKSDIKINKISRISHLRPQRAFEKNKNIDIVVSVKEKGDKYFYSKEFITFENIAVSRVEDNLKIDRISDLKGKKIIAFHGASLYLPREYRALFSNETKNYQEEVFQEKQVQEFLNGKTDVIILDKNIFIWFLKKLSRKSLNEFKLDYILPSNNSFKVAFRDVKIRDIFDTNFNLMKDSGEYQEILDSYLKFDILAKLEINTLISSLVSKFIYNMDIKEINYIIKEFENLPYINKIEIFSDELISFSSNKKYKNFSKQDSYFTIFNIPRKVGYIKVYFDEEELIKASNNFELIPDVNIFSHLDSFKYIKQKYSEFNYLNKDIKFTKKEKDFIKNNPVLSYSEINWKPLSIVSSDGYSGVFDDYIKLLQKYSGLTLKFTAGESLKDIRNKLKEKKISLLPMVARGKMEEYAKSSKEFASFNYVLVMNKNNKFLNNINDLKDKTFVLPKFYTSSKILKELYPKIKVIESIDTKESLSLISSGKADVTLIHEAVAIFNMQKFFPDLKIVGISKHKFNHHFSVHKDNAELLSIINKVISHISSKEHKGISDKWVNYKVSTAVDYRIIYSILFLFLFIFVITLYFMQKLRHAKEEIELEKKKFEALFSDTADPVILSKNGKYIDVNSSLLKLFKYKNKEDFLKMEPGSIAPKYQENKELSIVEMKKHLDKCYTNGTQRFQWKSKKSSGEIFWAEFVLTRLKYSNEDIIHMLCRDISESKELELKMQEQKDLFEALFKGTSDGLSLIEDNKIINCNYSLLKMYNIKDMRNIEDLKIISLAPKIQPDGQSSVKLYEKYQNLCEQNNYATFEMLTNKTTGEEFWVNIILIKIQTNSKNLIYSITRNISNRKFLEYEIQQKAIDLENSNDELEDSNEELQTTIQNLKQTQEQLIDSEKMAALGGLVAGVAHEINTPIGIGLTGITHLKDCTTDILKKYSSEEMSQEDFEKYLNISEELNFLVYKNLEKAATLVRSFKQVAVDQSSEEKRVFDIKEYLDEILKSIHSVTKKTNIKIEVFCEDDIKINSYAGAYSQIITNLIMNSIIHGFKEKEIGSITIHITKEEDELKIIYKDNGKGIKEENIGKIFDPFFTTNRDNGGSGLGLNIIYNIITSKLNGTIKCISQENKGVEFDIIIKI